VCEVGAVPTGLGPISQSTQGLHPGLTHSAPNGAVALALTSPLPFFEGSSHTPEVAASPATSESARLSWRFESYLMVPGCHRFLVLHGIAKAFGLDAELA
jgi:hypothetical protein